VHLNFHIINNTHDEIAMGHKLWFEPIHGCDVISATANAPGFTPLIAIARHYGWDYDMLARASNTCNVSGEVVIVQSVTPTLVLVPATKGCAPIGAIMADYLRALRAINPNCLHFTHYGFLQGHFPTSEVAVVLNGLLGGLLPHSIRALIVDVDIRRSAEFYNLMRPALPTNRSAAE
jgi:hypothetical protein